MSKRSVNFGGSRRTQMKKTDLLYTMRWLGMSDEEIQQKFQEMKKKDADRAKEEKWPHHAELEALKPDAGRMRRIQKVRKDHVGIPCACEFADDEETVLTWCAAHAALRDRAQAENDRLRAEISLCRDEALLDDSEEITRLRAALVALEGKG